MQSYRELSAFIKKTIPIIYIEVYVINQVKVFLKIDFYTDFNDMRCYVVQGMEIVKVKKEKKSKHADLPDE